MKGYKYRIYPTKEQQEIIDKTFNCCRYVWNGFLALKEFRFKEFGEKLNYNKMSALLTQIKKSDTFLNEVDSTALQQTLKQLESTYKNWFEFVKKNGVRYSPKVVERLKRKNKKPTIIDSEAHPKFKSKNNPKTSYKTTTCKIKGNQVLIPKVGLVDIIWSRKFNGKILSATISKTATEKYFISFCIDETTSKLQPVTKEIGIDLGLKTFAVCSDGQEFKAPKPMWKNIARLKKLQRKLSKKKDRKSNRYKKLKLQIALLHERIANIRKDFLHKLSTKLIQENQLICLESLDVKKMSKDKRISKAIMDSAFGTFVIMLKAKGEMYGRNVVQIDQYYASSQICSACGYQNVLVKDTSIRKWVCPQCGEEHDRDLNASINILVEGRKIH